MVRGSAGRRRRGACEASCLKRQERTARRKAADILECAVGGHKAQRRCEREATKKPKLVTLLFSPTSPSPPPPQHTPAALERATVAMSTAGLEGKEIWGSADDGIESEVASLTAAEIRQRATMLSNNARVLRTDITSLDQSIREQNDKIKDNVEKIKLNKQLPYLVGNVVEVRESAGSGPRARANRVFSPHPTPARAGAGPGQGRGGGGGHRRGDGRHGQAQGQELRRQDDEPAGAFARSEERSFAREARAA
jgi:hypothetical protein